MVQLTETLRARRDDDRNICLEEYREIVDERKKTSRMDWDIVGFYNSFSTLLIGALKRYELTLCEEDKYSLEEALEKIKSLVEVLKNVKVEM